MNEKLSVIVLTYNSEDNLKRCLSSVEWANEIIVVDSFSKDGTLKVAESFGAKIFQRKYTGYTRQLEFGIGKAGNNWVFVLDSDEEVTPKLTKEINEVLKDTNERIGGYEISRRVHFLGRWIMHGSWYPDYQYRLFRRDLSEPKHLEIHSSYGTKQERGKLKSPINHYSYKNLYDYVMRINTYTTLETSTRLKTLGEKRVKWYNFFLNPFSVFFRMYIVNKGYKDGIQGLILALFSSFYNLALYAKIWEYQMSDKLGYEKPPISNSTLQEYRSKGDNI